MAVGFGVAVPKPEPLKRVRGRKTRAEAKVKSAVRAQCYERDGYCRLFPLTRMVACKGGWQWAHLGEKKRFKTRKMAPEVRHTTAGSLILCERHHTMYDGRFVGGSRPPRLLIEALTERGADGPLRFTLATVPATVYVETHLE